MKIKKKINIKIIVCPKSEKEEELGKRRREEKRRGELHLEEAGSPKTSINESKMDEDVSTTRLFAKS